MKTWTLRNIPDDLMRLFRHEAKARHTSINKVIVKLLIEKFGLEKTKKSRVHHDLDHWFGKWTLKEADDMNQFIMGQRHLDKK